MDKEKEIEEMYNVVKCGLDVQFACGDEIEIGDKEAAAEIIVEDLQKAGYGNVKRAVKEVLAEIKAKVPFGIVSGSFVWEVIDEVFKRFYGEGDNES